MMDSISESRLLLVSPPLATKISALENLLEHRNEVIRVTQGLRSWSEQDTLWNRGRTTAGVPCIHAGVIRVMGTCQQHPLGTVVTNCRGGYSYHNFGMAVDCTPSRFGLDQPYDPDWNSTHQTWKEMEALGQSLGLTSGSVWRTFPDAPHFQLTGIFPEGAPNDEVRQTFQAAGMEAVWKESGILTDTMEDLS